LPRLLGKLITLVYCQGIESKDTEVKMQGYKEI